MENEEAAKALCPDCGCGGCLEELIVKENSKDVVNQTINEESEEDGLR
tara:strand:+ start:2928 stop:3071 length:144 start_codon:yes stop_codon:yes gene_type:complete